MKNMVKKWLLPVVVVAAVSVTYFTLGGPPPNPTPALSTYIDTDNSVRFVVSNLPYFVTSGTQRYSIMLNPGDGTCFTESITLRTGVHLDTLPHRHYYAQTAARSVYTEMTALDYTDTDEPPKSMRAATTVTPTVASTVDYTIALNGWAKIESTRKVIKGDSVTYIVTYQNPSQNGCSSEVHGNVIIHYDTTKLKYIRTDKYFSESSFNHTFSGNAGALTWTYLHLQPREQRNLFLVFFAKNNIAVRDTLNPTPTLTFTHGNDSGSLGDPCSNASMTAVHTASNTVAYSHDPNEKTADLQSICKSDQYITYTIRFQNEGQKAARKVVVSDELTALFDKDMVPEFIASSHASDRAQVMATKRFIVVTFDTIGQRNFLLRGTHEPGYGREFGESATMGYITFRAKLPAFADNLHCRALANRARIIFDCNPSIWTSPEITPFACNNSCASCTQLPDIIATGFATQPGAPFVWADNSELKGLIDSLVAKNFQFIWYPKGEISNPDAAIPNIANTQSQYIVIANNPATCQRVVIHVSISFGVCAEMKIKTDAAGLQASNCSGGYIHAWVEGGTPPFRWMDCEPPRQRIDTLKQDRLMPGTYYLGVTDRKGCTTETWVEIKTPPNPLHVDDDPRDCDATLRITGGAPPYITQWQAVRNGQSESSTESELDMGQVTSAKVTVTDSKGCSVVFTPQSTNCKGYDTGPGWLTAIWVLLSLVLAGAGFSFWRQRNSKKQ